MSEDYWKSKEAAREFEAYWNQRNKASLEKRWGLVKQLAKGLPYSTILDVGCGIGNLVAFTSLAKPNNYLGIDISPPMIERARALHPDYQFKVLDPMEPIWRWDLVVAHGFLLHQHNLFLKLHRLKELSQRYLIFDVLVTKEGYSRRSPQGYWTRVLGNEEYAFMKKELEDEFSLEEVKFGEWSGHREYYLKLQKDLR